MFSFSELSGHYFFFDRTSIKITPAATTITATHKSGLLESPVAGLPLAGAFSAGTGVFAAGAAADPEAGAVPGFGAILGAGALLGTGASLGAGVSFGAGAASTVSVVTASPSSKFTVTVCEPTLKVSR